MADQSVNSNNLSLASNSNVYTDQTQLGDNDRRLSSILEMAKVLATEHNLETLLTRLFLCLIETVVAAEAGILFIYDRSNGFLRVEAAAGYDLSKLSQLKLVPREMVSERIFQTIWAETYPTPEAIATARKNMAPTNYELFDAAIIGSEQPQSAICLPLITGQTKMGRLLLENRSQPNSFVETDLTLLQAEADLIALAAENVHLKTELQTSRSLQEANRLKAELISTLAHELRTPLTSIKGYSTALLSEEVSLLPETEREFLEIIDEECDILQHLIHDLLESSIIEAGLLRLVFQPVMLPRLAKSVIDDFARRNEQHRFLVDFPKHFPIVDADPNRIAQVLRNLLSNAVKYSPQGGLVVVRGEVQAEEIILSVADQGVGISPEHLNQLFDRFFRVEAGLSRPVTGSGLGLPIARTIVESHNGRIWAESQVGQGSTFYFSIPLEGLSRGLAA